MTGGSDGPHVHDVVVVGGGFSGIAALHVLRQRGLDVLLVEAGEDVGGVWYWNTYPGVRCDVETYEYSFAFPEVEQEWEWSHRLATGEQLQAHIAYTTDRYGLREHIAFGARILAADYDEDLHRWTLTAEDGRTFVSRATVWATGVLSASQLPDIAGVDDFRGVALHTGEWPEGGIEVAGRRVGVVGTGSSGVQIIPTLAPEVDELVVFQRTANHVVPANNVPIDDEWRAELRATVTERRAASRASAAGLSLNASSVSALDVDDDERRAVYEEHWQAGGFSMLRAFSDVATDLRAAATADAFVRDKIREVIDDPAVAERLMPGGHPINTKRLGIGVGWYETFNRDNVRLCDARTEGIERITEDGVLLTTGEEIPLDVLVFATGFDSFTGALTRVDIRGRDGRILRDAWKDGARTYVGMGVAGFPNMFLVGGPGSPSIFANAPIASEHSAGWIGDLLVRIAADGVTEVEALPDAEEEWTQHLIEAAEKTLFRELRTTWYHGANVPGKKRLFMGYVGGVDRYNARLAEIAERGYEGFRLRGGGG